MNKILFLDMDGVIVDFMTRAKQVHNIDIPMKDLRWDFFQQAGIPAKEFWDKLDFDFWASLDWTPEGRYLIGGLEALIPPEKIVLLTSPCDTIGSIEGKIEWIRSHMPSYKRRFLVGPPKYALSHANTCLVDDSDYNCEDFEAQGTGLAIMTPRPWNRLRNHTDENGGFDVHSIIQQVREWWRT